MKNDQKIAISIYLSKGYIPLFNQFLKSYQKYNRGLNVDFVVWLDPYININDMSMLGIDSTVLPNNILFTNATWGSTELYEKRAQENRELFHEGIKYTYYKLQGLELLREYDFVIFCDVDITVLKPWDLDYLTSKGKDIIPDCFGYCQKGDRGGQMDINTGFVIFHKNENSEKDIEITKEKALNEFRHLPDQHIIFEVFPVHRCNRKLNRDYNCSDLLDSTINYHRYGQSDNKKH